MYILDIWMPKERIVIAGTARLAVVRIAVDNKMELGAVDGDFC